MTILLDHMKGHPMIANVMIIDDQLTSRIILETIVQSIGTNIKVKTFDNAITALDVIASEPPDLIIADYKMPELDGVEFTRQLRTIPSCNDVPVIIITIIEEKTVMYQALEAGATDFLTKPVDHYECKVRCRNLLTMRQQQIIIKNRTHSLETKIKEATEQIHTRELETLYRLARAGEFKDSSTGMHLIQMARVSRIIAEEIGMDVNFCDVLEIAAPMHDIGKIGIPDDVLLKESELDEKEFEVMKTHTQIGYEILKDSPSPYLQMGAIIALNHHEKFNGEGYPNKLRGDVIPIEARIVAVADVFDALVSNRTYKDAWDLNDTIEHIIKLKFAQFDPDCANAVLKHADDIMASREIPEMKFL